MQEPSTHPHDAVAGGHFTTSQVVATLASAEQTSPEQPPTKHWSSVAHRFSTAVPSTRS